MKHQWAVWIIHLPSDRCIGRATFATEDEVTDMMLALDVVDGYRVSSGPIDQGSESLCGEQIDNPEAAADIVVRRQRAAG